MSRKLIIVSSYKIPCGIAQYLEHLEGPLRELSDFEVEVCPLPVSLLRARTKFAKKLVDKYFYDLNRKIKSATVVNLQLEPGLFGVGPFEIWSRLSKIIAGASKVIITYHTVPQLGAGRYSFRPRDFLRRIQAWRGNYIFSRLLYRVRKDNGKFFHILQTRRDAEVLRLLGVAEKNIAYQPLSFINDFDKALLVKSVDSVRRRIKENYNIEGKLLGVFGFLAPYKGIDVAIRCLSQLKDDFHLLVVGGLHPEGIEFGKAVPENMEKLMDLISETELSGRVHFLGSLSNSDFNEVMSACDSVILPYAEVGQTSSGPASIALDLELPIYCSRNNCFKELDAFQPGILSFFEMGNHLELAEKIRLEDATEVKRKAARSKYSEKYNIRSRASLYVKAFRTLVEG